MPPAKKVAAKKVAPPAKKPPAKKATEVKLPAKKVAPPKPKITPRKKASQHRVLLYSGEGVGKTDAYLDLINASRHNGFILDCDGSVGYTISHMGLDEEDLGVKVWDCSDPFGTLVDPNGVTSQHETQWLAMEAASRSIRKSKPRLGDWIIIERIDKLWTAVQSHWGFMAYGDSDTDYWTSFREEMIDANDKTNRSYGGFSGSRDWPYIRKAYNSVVLGLLSAPLASKLATTLSKEPFPMGANVDDQKAMYGSMMPAGEPNQGSEFWLIAEIKVRKDQSRSLFVRRIKRKDFTIDNPYIITNDDGESDFASWMKEVWGWDD